LSSELTKPLRVFLLSKTIVRWAVAKVLAEKGADTIAKDNN
jgi:hypothetical protein